MRICKSCGFENTDPNNKFCINCGAALNPPTELIMPKDEFCLKCGTPYNEDDAFCYKCGAKRNESDSGSKKTSTDFIPKKDDASFVPAAQKKRGLPAAVIVLISLVMIGAGTVFIYFLVNGAMPSVATLTITARQPVILETPAPSRKELLVGQISPPEDFVLDNETATEEISERQISKEENEEQAVIKEEKEVQAVIKEEKIEPSIIENEITEPTIIKNEITKPMIIENEITKPTIIENEIIEPAIIENEITEPAANETGDFILPFSGERRLTEDDLKNLTQQELRIARNEIYARHGRQFTSRDLQDYFNSKKWYVNMVKLPAGTEPALSAIEIANVELISSFEAR